MNWIYKGIDRPHLLALAQLTHFARSLSLFNNIVVRPSICVRASGSASLRMFKRRPTHLDRNILFFPLPHCVAAQLYSRAPTLTYGNCTLYKHLPGLTNTALRLASLLSYTDAKRFRAQWRPIVPKSVFPLHVMHCLGNRVFRNTWARAPHPLLQIVATRPMLTSSQLTAQLPLPSASLLRAHNSFCIVNRIAGNIFIGSVNVKSFHDGELLA